MPESSTNQAGARGWARVYDVVGRIFVWEAEVEREADLAALDGEAWDAASAEAASLLTSAGCLVAALRTLDNRWHEVLEELYLFDSSWPRERRDHVILEIRHFTGQELILPIVHQSAAQLRRKSERVLELGLSDFADELDELLKCGNTILKTLGKTQVSPYLDSEELDRFLTKVRDASTPTDVESVEQYLKEALRVLDRSILARANRAFGRLKDDITRRYPSIPDPGWVVSLDDIRLPSE